MFLKMRFQYATLDYFRNIFPASSSTVARETS